MQELSKLNITSRITLKRHMLTFKMMLEQREQNEELLEKLQLRVMTMRRTNINGLQHGQIHSTAASLTKSQRKTVVMEQAMQMMLAIRTQIRRVFLVGYSTIATITKEAFEGQTSP